jgi:hypothetical protein
LLRVLVHESTPTGLPVMMVYSSHGTPSLRMRAGAWAWGCFRTVGLLAQ